MRTIASLNGPDFLRACNKVRHAVHDFLEETGVHNLRKVLPENLPKIPTDAPESEKLKVKAERAKMLEAQAKKNMDAIFDRLLDEYPEATYELLCTVAIPDEGETLTGFDLIDAGVELISSEKTMDFFIKLANLDGRITGA